MALYRHVLMLNPYFGDSTAAMGVFPPTGIEYIAASLEGFVDKITLLDLRYERVYQNPAVLSRFIRGGIDLLCIGIQWDAQFENICGFIRQLPDEVTTVVGGRKATEEVETLFERCPNIDAIVRGEGEEIIRQFVTGVPFREIRGLSYREGGGIVHNENQELPDLAHIAFPDRSLRGHDYYWAQSGIRLSRLSFDTVLTTRGCPFKCKFCTFSLNPLGQKRQYTERPLESVIEELKTVTADFVLFSDDNMFTNPSRAEQLCDLIVEHGIRKRFIVQARIDVARHPRLLDKAQRAGFKVFLIGVESPHDRILTQLQKGITQQQIREALSVLRQYNFYLHGYFIYGNIGETEEEMLYIPTFARELGLDSISFQKLRVEKYSPLKEIVESTPGYHYERIGGPVYSDRYGLKELKRIRNDIRSRFYTPWQLLRTASKARRIGLLTGWEVASALTRLPLVAPIMLWNHAGKKRRKRKAKQLRVAGLGTSAGRTGHLKPGTCYTNAAIKPARP